MFKGFLKVALKGGLICAAIAFCAKADVPPTIPIASFEDLCKIGKDAGYPLSGIYELTGDIDASPSRGMNGGKGFEPIGSIAEPPEDFIEGFSGTFYGNGYVIRGLYINRPYEEGVGLFKRLGNNFWLAFANIESVKYTVPEIRNLGLEVDTIIGKSHVGGLTGQNHGGIITDCGVSGTVIAVEDMVGGLAGGNYVVFIHIFGWSADFYLVGNITNCYSTANVSSLGMPTNGCGGTLEQINNCGWDSPYAAAGGLVGLNFRGNISGSYATGDVSGFKNGVGGLAGYTSSWGTSITNSYATGKVSTLAGGAGGLVGINNSGTIRRSYATGPVQAGGDAGGLVGYNFQAEITDCYAKGDVTADINAGGLVGYYSDFGYGHYEYAGLGKRNNDKISPAPPAPPYITIRNSYATGTAQTTSQAQVVRNIGGLVGLYNFTRLDRFSPGIVNSYWDVTTSGMNISGGDNEAGAGKTTAEMMAMSTFKDWNFESVWRLDEGEGYPYLAWQDNNTSISYNNRANRTHTNALMPQISVRGRTLNVKLSSSQQSSPQNLQIRVIDMRGRTVHSRVVNSSVNTLSLTKIPAGRYVVEVKNSGVRVGSVAVVVR